ncbi:MAG: hypothetical protein ACLRVQ_01495 [Lachnospiraceae bacterium]
MNTIKLNNSLSLGFCVKSGNRNGKSQKKAVNYNAKELSNALMNARSSQGAKQVAVMAKIRLSSLLRCQNTGIYDETALRAAISHARRMVYCAAIKSENLADEEKEKREQEKLKKASKPKDENEALLRELEEELNRKRKSNRIRENGEINSANSAYLEKRIRDLKQESLSAEYTDRSRCLSDISADMPSNQSSSFEITI